MSLLLQILLCYFVLDKYYICLFLFTYYYESPSDPLNMMTVHFHSALFVCDSAMQLTIQCTFGRRKHSSGSHLNEILQAPSSRSFQPSSKLSRKKGVRSVRLRLILAAKPAAVGTGQSIPMLEIQRGELKVTGLTDQSPKVLAKLRMLGRFARDQVTALLRGNRVSLTTYYHRTVQE